MTISAECECTLSRVEVQKGADTIDLARASDATSEPGMWMVSEKEAELAAESGCPGKAEGEQQRNFDACLDDPRIVDANRGAAQNQATM